MEEKYNRCQAISPKRKLRCMEVEGHGSEQPEITGIDRWKKKLSPQSHYAKDPLGKEWTWFDKSVSETLS